MSEFTPAMRDAIGERDLWRCVRCGRYLGHGANVHHRRLRSQGGLARMGNGILLCGSGTTGCHGFVHANVAGAREAGWIVPSWDEPHLIPVRTWRGRMVLRDDGSWVLAEPDAVSGST